VKLTSIQSPTIILSDLIQNVKLIRHPVQSAQCSHSGYQVKTTAPSKLF